jgi:hypothetical protein
VRAKEKRTSLFLSVLAFCRAQEREEGGLSACARKEERKGGSGATGGGEMRRSEASIVREKKVDGGSFISQGQLQQSRELPCREKGKLLESPHLFPSPSLERGSLSINQLPSPKAERKKPRTRRRTKPGET